MSVRRIEPVKVTSVNTVAEPVDIIAKKYCVYKLTSPSGKVYIGMTCLRIKERWKRGLGYEHNVLLYADIQNYGWDNFKHEIVAENLTEEEALKLEGELIHKYKSIFPEYGYNRRPGTEYADEFLEAKEARKQSAEQLQYYPPHEPKVYEAPLKDTCWVTKDGYETLISSIELDDYIAQGWCRGRAVEIVYMYNDYESIRVPVAEESRYLAMGYTRGRPIEVLENIRKARQQFIWKCDNMEFDSAKKLAEYLRAHYYPKIVGSTITTAFRRAKCPNYPKLLEIVSRIPVEH